MIKLGAKELRNSQPDAQKIAELKRNPIYIVLDNILDTYNVGAIFRLADAVAAEKVFLCGETATPEDAKVGHKIEKASVGTYKWVKWEYCQSAVDVVVRLRSGKWEVGSEINGFKNSTSKRSHLAHRTSIQIVAVEQHPKSIPYTEAKYQFPLAIVVGHETDGVSKAVLEISDMIVEIPMWGVNKSLNVMVSCAIVLYEVMKGVDRRKEIW